MAWFALVTDMSSPRYSCRGPRSGVLPSLDVSLCLLKSKSFQGSEHFLAEHTKDQIALHLSMYVH